MFMDIDGHPVDMSENDSAFLNDWSMILNANSHITKQPRLIIKKH